MAPPRLFPIPGERPPFFEASSSMPTGNPSFASALHSDRTFSLGEGPFETLVCPSDQTFRFFPRGFFFPVPFFFFPPTGISALDGRFPSVFPNCHPHLSKRPLFPVLFFPMVDYLSCLQMRLRVFFSCRTKPPTPLRMDSPNQASAVLPAIWDLVARGWIFSPQNLWVLLPFCLRLCFWHTFFSFC